MRAAPTAPPPEASETEATLDRLWPWGAGAALGLVVAVLFWPRRASAAALPSAYYPGPAVEGGSVLSRYGWRTKAGVRKFHDGIDLAAHRGTPIRAVGAGIVRGVWADGEISGYGNLVVIQHKEGEGALYAHMDTIDGAMRVGSSVEPGQLVGTVGCTDSEGGFPCDGSHLHLEIFTPAPGDTRAWTHFHGGGDAGYPARTDPAAWAAERGLRLV